MRRWACRAPVTIVRSHAWSERVARASSWHRPLALRCEEPQAVLALWHAVRWMDNYPPEA